MKVATLSLEQAAERLSRLLEEENAALLAADFGRAGALLAAKHAAADALAAAWRFCLTNDMPEPQMRTLAALAEENRRLLSRAMRVQRRVLDLVARAARAASPSAPYTQVGRVKSTAVSRAVSKRA